MMMDPGVPQDLLSGAQDGGIVLAVNGMTAWVKTKLADFALPAWTKRLYFVLPVACAAVVCYAECQDLRTALMCGIKYGVLASYLKTADRSGIQGR